MQEKKLVYYDGIKTRDKVYYLCFKNEKGGVVEIPVEEQVAKHIELYVGQINQPHPHNTIFGNDEESLDE